MKMDSKRIANDGCLLLEPFPHQVGGHSGVLRYDDTTVCKPLISREEHFYETIPEELLEFTAQFKGVLDVTIEQDGNGKPLFIALPEDVDLLKSQTFQRQNSGTLQSNEAASNVKDWNTEQACSNSVNDSLKLEARQVQLMIKKSILGNPWALRCYQAQLARLGSQRHRHKFILLENLIGPYARPCILDLKMGTRIHGDDASEEKKQRQKIKCQMSTSSTLGFYIGGMQVYHPDSGSYLCYDKYEGRGLDVVGVQNALYQFFNDGQHLLSSVIRAVVDKLNRLQAVLAKKNTFRFYSSSLLLMYDGLGCCGLEAGVDDNGLSQCHGLCQQHSNSPTPLSKGNVWNKLKFGKSSMSNRSFSETQLCKTGSVDKGERNGVADDTFQSLSKHDLVSVCSSQRDIRTNSPLPSMTPISEIHANDVSTVCRQNQEKNGTKTLPAATIDMTLHCGFKVDVRMIDFAHVTYNGFNTTDEQHSGPDHGYLFGLSNLITMLNQLPEVKEK